MKKATVAAGIAVFVVLGGVAAGLAYIKKRQIASSVQPAFEPAESVEIAPARIIRWQPHADLVGTVFSLRTVRVKNELPGLVKAVRFQSGDIVQAGQVLVELDDTQEQADLEAAKAAVRVSEAGVLVGQARVRLAESEAARQAEAAAARAVSELEVERARSELDKAKADLARARAEVDESQAKVKQVEARLAKLVLRSPIRARASLRNVHEGQFLTQQMMPDAPPVVVLEEVADKIYLDFAVPQEYVPRITKGLKVMATSSLLGAEPVEIEVEAVDATVDNATRNVRVRALVDNRSDRLRPGMFVPIRVPVDEERPFVAVPSTAVRRTSYADMVFVIAPGPDGKQLRAQQRFVKLGPTTGGMAIVLEGVKEGDAVATTGAFKLRDGALVMKVEPGNGKPTGAAARGE